VSVPSRWRESRDAGELAPADAASSFALHEGIERSVLGLLAG